MGAILEAWLGDDAVAHALQVNIHRDVRWFNREAFERLAAWTAAVERVRAGQATTGPQTPAAFFAQGTELAQTMTALIDAAARSGYRLDLLRAAAEVDESATPVVRPGGASQTG